MEWTSLHCLLPFAIIYFMHPSKYEHKLERAAKIGLWALLVLPLYVSGSMLFPFITGKNFMFRIVVELVAILWVGLMLVSPEYRPRLTRLVKISTIFVFIVFLADLFGPNPYRSFFSNYERMEGFMMIGHLWLYFMMLASIMKAKKDWLIFFHATLAVSAIVSVIALLQKFGLQVSQQGGFRVDATIGNPAYLAAYLLFHIWLGAIFLERFWKHMWLRATYAALVIFEIVIVYFTATRGAVIALILGMLFILACSVWDWRRMFPERKKYPVWAAVLLGVVVVVPVIFWQLRHTSIVKLSPVLPRFASISLTDNTTQARFSIWRMSFRGAMARPILGWGQENYYLVFQKYYDPRLYAQEPWFDRSHDIILDWLVHTGFLGLIAYLSLFGTAVWGIILAMRRHAISRWEGVVLGTAFLAYFIQNLLVFDNLNTYLLFFGLLAYADYTGETAGHEYAEGRHKSVPERTAYVVIAALFAVWIPIVYMINIKPMLEAKALIRALLVRSAHAPLGIVQDAFAQALAYHTFGDTEVREQIANVARAVPGASGVSGEEQKQFVEFAVDEMRKQISGSAPDVKHMVFLSSIMDRSAALDSALPREAEAIMRTAIQIAPTKQILYFELAQVYLVESKPDDAIAALRTAIALDTSYEQAAVDLMIVGGLAKRADAVHEGGALVHIDTMDEDVVNRVANAYQQINDFSGAEIAFRRLVQMNPGHAQYHATLAALLAQNHKNQEAIHEAEEAARLDPGFVPESDRFIRSLGGKP